MADQTFKDRVKQIFEEAIPRAFVDVSDGYRDNVHVVIVSRRFDGLTEREKDDYLWSIVRPALLTEAERISLLLGYSPDELK
jgi:hypothetical protein